MGFFSAAQSVRNKFTDLFSARANTTGDLGKATDGSFWNPINSTMQISSGAAIANTTPASGGTGDTYPIATQIMPTQNNTITLTGTNEGSGVAIWVQSSTDWWLVDSTANQTSSTNYTSSDVFNYTSSGGYTASTAYSASYFWLDPFVFYTAGSTTYTGSVTYTSAYSYTNYTSSSSTSFAQYLRIKQSVGSTVSQISSLTLSSSQTARSIKVIINGNIITASGYSDVNLTTQLGSNLVYTATGATVNTEYGISLSPSLYNQSTTIATSANIVRN